MPWLVWFGGRATWVVGADGFYGGDLRRPYPRVRCEVCDRLACGVEVEVVDLTQPEDAVIGSIPGRPHHYCRFHGKQVTP